MMNEIEKRGLDLLADRIVEVVDAVTKKAPGYLYAQYKNQELLVNKGLPDYLRAQYSKCDTIRTLIRRDTPSILSDLYEAPNFRIDERLISSEGLREVIGGDVQPVVVTGLAGSGKSVFLKSLFTTSIEEGYTYYPIFFELRSIGQLSNGGLLGEVFASIQNFADGFTRSQFEFGLKRGNFYLLIDALDETPNSEMERVSQEIIEITRKYPKCPLVLTSRPNNDFSTWEGFTQARLQPFSKDQCVSYIGKIPYDKAKKTEFLEALERGLFERHAEFLSNPLLASMMLLTYDEYGEIPARRHIFFEKCFQVLLREHDVSKGKYRREFHSGLDYSSVEAILQSFCVFTYLERKFSFSRTEALAYVTEAGTATGQDVDAVLFLDDLVASISILQQDGDFFEFVHRSFQEFFYARFVVSDREYSIEEKIKEFTTLDDVIDMVADMDRVYFEQNFILPRLKHLNQTFSKNDPMEKPDLILNKFFARMQVTRNKKDEVDEELGLSFSVSHIENEFEPRGLNLALHKHVMKNYRDFFPHARLWPKYKDDDLREALGVENNRDAVSSGTFTLRAENRERLLSIGAGVYASGIKDGLAALEVRLQAAVAARANSLASKLRRGKS